MGSLIAWVSAVMIWTLIWGLKKGLGGVPMVFLLLGATSATVVLRSSYLHSLAMDQISPFKTRTKVLQRQMEQVYLDRQASAHLNLLLDYTKATQDMNTLSAMGLRRMSDEDLIRRSELVVQLCKFGGETICAGFLTGEIDFKRLGDALNQISDAEAKDWNRITCEAIARELAGTSYPAVNQREFNEAFYRVLASIPLKERLFVAARVEDLHERRPVEISEVAQSTEILYRAISKIGAPYGPAYLRFAADLAIKGERVSTRNLSSDNVPLAGLPESGIRPLTPGEAAAVKAFGKAQAEGDTVFSAHTVSIQKKK